MIHPRKNLIFIFPIFVFFSCNNSSDADQQKKIDSMFPQKNNSENVVNKDSAAEENANDEKVEKPFHLSAKDSARIADSIHNAQNGVRDFK